MGKKALRAAGFAAVFVAAGAAGAWAYVSARARGLVEESLAALPPANAALVLGTAPTVRGGRPNRFFTRRIEAAAALFAAGKAKYLIVSGNQSQGGHDRGGYDEPYAMRAALIAKGVPATRIYCDYAGFHTLDSVVRAKEVFGQSDVIVVSQRFHAERAVYLARARGLAFTGYAAKDVSRLYGARTMAREVVSRLGAVWYAVSGQGARIGGAPITLGHDAPA